MERKEPEDVPFDGLAARLQEALSQGLIQHESPGYDVARALIESKWKDLSEEDRAIFNKHLRPVVGE